MTSNSSIMAIKDTGSTFLSSMSNFFVNNLFYVNLISAYGNPPFTDYMLGMSTSSSTPTWATKIQCIDCSGIGLFEYHQIIPLSNVNKVFSLFCYD